MSEIDSNKMPFDKLCLHSSHEREPAERYCEASVCKKVLEGRVINIYIYIYIYRYASKHTHTTHARIHTHTCTHAHARTHARTHAHTHTHTHTELDQVIHQLIGTDNVHILRETARAEKAEPAPAPQLYHSARPAPHIFYISWPAAQPAPHWSGPQPAPPRNKSKNPARTQAAGLNARARARARARAHTHTQIKKTIYHKSKGKFKQNAHCLFGFNFSVVLINTCSVCHFHNRKIIKPFPCDFVFIVIKEKHLKQNVHILPL